ncbi:MAG: ATPase [Alphaproteobacteria bacterium RIFCSPLOWO2_01_FULL_40_26]|nr:MAG: ATPase [Alphaproteobacteria bacterium RIFCSPHIGHO2_02_FULL_40_34]OFW95525.1 MAG: ATPase [Alphaproteobacteria bacterium RIFCSPLOWO2_01_FULL_40_26]OFX09635.1 MAG: ATPase [Alphaproteobacteria bacterium RIFCSPLOWO2_02_FULL_40_19]OFX11348.1 MAG: ATPase [Alphaproteobacteria bacterium RIFCSPLOWO2_12_FULL_40_11]
MTYNRELNLTGILAKKSIFLFGPRTVGKTYLIRQQLGKEALLINLLNSEMYLRLSSNPSLIRGIISDSKKKLIVIDEIQRIPELLNEVHDLIETQKLRFLLTGSSARKLRGRGINLLAGRAWQANLFPLTSSEIKKFNLSRYLQFGGLPAVYGSKYPEEELDAYVNTYLKEEIQAESLIRKIPAFTRFLQVAALTSGQMINFSNIASDAAAPLSTVREYYQILQDTLVGFMLPAWTKSKKRKAITTAKFYFFDIGVRNAIAGIKKIDPLSEIYGQAFEHFLILETRAYLSYRRVKKEISYWRSKNGHEVDLIIGNEIAIEIKSTKSVADRHLKNLNYLAEEKITKRHILVSQDNLNRKSGKIEIMHWQKFLEILWQNKLQ